MVVMLKGRNNRTEKGVLAYYGMSSDLLLEVLYKENGISRSQQDRRVDGSLQTKGNTSNFKGFVAE